MYKNDVLGSLVILSQLGCDTGASPGGSTNEDIYVYFNAIIDKAAQILDIAVYISPSLNPPCPREPSFENSSTNGENRITAADNMNFVIEKSEFCVIVGPSGAGKTTLLNILEGMDSCDSHIIILDNQQISGMSEFVVLSVDNHTVKSACSIIFLQCADAYSRVPQW